MAVLRRCKHSFVVYIVFLTILGITWKTAALRDNGCSHTYHAPSGTLSSLSYHSTRGSVEIETSNWRISARSDEKIILNITDIDIKRSTDCSLGYVEVRDGFWPNSPLLGRYCGSGSLAPLMSSHNKMLVSYFYNSTSSHRGFFANYEAICGCDLYIDKEYLLEYHKSKAKYASSRKCIWNIMVPEGQKVVLRFQQFELQEEEHCLSDYMEIYDGPSENSPSNGTFCGNGVPPDMISTSNNLLIKFVSDGSVQKGGFSALIKTEYDEIATNDYGCAHHYIDTVEGYQCICEIGYELQTDGKNCERVCGGILDGRNGTIKSPSFPELYPPNKTCIWEIVTEPGNMISLDFTHFDIEGKNVSQNTKHRCEKDMVDVFSKIGSNRTRRHGSYCGNILPDPVVSDTNAMKIVFASDIDVQKTGFALDYFTFTDNCRILNGNCYHQCANIPSGFRKCQCGEGYVSLENGFNCRKNDCDYEIASSFGYVDSPNYPGSYPVNKVCSWRFKTAPGHRVQISFLDFHTEVHAQCTYDYVAIYDGPFANSSRLATYCGTTLPSARISTTHELHMVFRADQSNVFKGFHAKHEAICGGTLQARTEKKYIFSHADYASSNYRSNTSCEWTIQPLAQHNTSLTFETFQLEDTVDCEFDFVEILEGDSSLGKFCGNTKPTEVFVSNTKLLIRFHSDKEITDKGFIIMYQAVKDVPEGEVQTV